jgi:hypothetical protein
VLGKSVSGILDFAIRLSISLVVAWLIWGKVRLPLPALVSVAQMVFYLTLCFVPPRLNRVLLLDQIAERATTLQEAKVVLHLTPAQLATAPVTVPVSEFWDTSVEKASRIRFVSRIAASRNRKIDESFLHNVIPVLSVVGLTVAFSLVLTTVPVNELKEVGLNPLSPVVSFAQGLIGLIPLLWTFGILYGEIICHRDTVFSALD